VARVTIATITIDETKLAALKAGVFKKQPVPDGVSEADHLQALGDDYFNRLSAQGTREIIAAEQEVNVDTRIVNE
jgi:hypothetical protein